MSDSVRKQKFIRELAAYLAGPDQVRRSIGLQMGNPDAQQWARIRHVTPLSGYPSVEEAVQQLSEWLGIPTE